MIKIKKKALKSYTFIDLFCGLGAFRLALESFGAKCLFSSEINEQVAETYNQNFKTYPSGDITKIKTMDIPKHDILCAGFPCQPFSISGKKLGFLDTRGTLFFEILRIAKQHKPKIILLENVKNLKTHDDGKTYLIIKNSLEAIGYTVFSDILNASDFKIPQYRERIYIVAVKNDFSNKQFIYPGIKKKKQVIDILDDKVDDKYTISRPDIHILKTHNTRSNKIEKIGYLNKGGQGERIYSTYGQAITISAQGGGAGAKTGLYSVDGIVRKLTPNECRKLMGFPLTYKFSASDAQACKQFGNSIVVDVLQYIIKELIEIYEL